MKNEPEKKIFSKKLVLALILIAVFLLVALLGAIFGMKLHKNNDVTGKSSESEGTNVIVYVLYKLCQNALLAMTLVALS